MLFADLDLRAGTAVSSLPVKSGSWVSSSLCPRSSPRPETRTVHPMLPRIVVVVVVASRRFRLPCSRSSWKKQSQTFGSIRVAWVVGIFTGLQLEPTCRCFCLSQSPGTPETHDLGKKIACNPKSRELVPSSIFWQGPPRSVAVNRQPPNPSTPKRR